MSKTSAVGKQERRRVLPSESCGEHLQAGRGYMTLFIEQYIHVYMMKIIDILKPQKVSAEDCIYSSQVKPDFPGECFESWPDFEDSEDEQDELKLSFREGNKRTASDEFCGDLKRIKFDNNVRDLTDNLSFKLDLLKPNQELNGAAILTTCGHETNSKDNPK